MQMHTTPFLRYRQQSKSKLRPWLLVVVGVGSGGCDCVRGWIVDGMQDSIADSSGLATRRPATHFRPVTCMQPF